MGNPLSFTPDLSVILPTYNERENIVDLVQAIHAALKRENGGRSWRYEVLVVADNRPDGTADAVRRSFCLGENNQIEDKQCAVRLVVRTQDRGLAKSIREGLTRAVGQTLVVMDTDFNHDPAMIPQMV